MVVSMATHRQTWWLRKNWEFSISSPGLQASGRDCNTKPVLNIYNLKDHPLCHTSFKKAPPIPTRPHIPTVPRLMSLWEPFSLKLSHHLAETLSNPLSSTISKKNMIRIYKIQFTDHMKLKNKEDQSVDISILLRNGIKLPFGGDSETKCGVET